MLPQKAVAETQNKQRVVQWNSHLGSTSVAELLPGSA